MDSNSTILALFIAFMLGSVVTLVSLDVFVMQPNSEKRTQVVSELISDVKQSELEAALMIVHQCKDLGYAFVRSDETSGYYLSCEQNSFEAIADSRVQELSKNVKHYSSKRYHTKD